MSAPRPADSPKFCSNAAPRHVFAIDVGHGQIDATLRADPRVIVRERLNARVSDPRRPERRGTRLHRLRRQFCLAQAGPAGRTRACESRREGGRSWSSRNSRRAATRSARAASLKDPADGPRIADELAAWLETNPGWRSLGWKPSPIDGGDGNREFLLGGVKDRG